MPRTVTQRDVEALAVGGSILGGGGGGSPELGLRDGRLALSIGDITLYGPEEADPEWLVVTCAALGAPTEPGGTTPRHFIRAGQLLREVGVCYDGFIAAENGGQNSFGGWVTASALGLPVVDAPADGRAHPTAVMGGMGLHRIDYRSVKVGVTEGSEVVAWGSLKSTSGVIRAQAGEMKALIALVRDPVRVSYACSHGAPGALSRAIDLGFAFMEKQSRSPEAKVQTAVDFLGGELVAKAVVVEKTAKAQGGFDVGFMTLREAGRELELSYVNEYMTLEEGGERTGTFPDLLATFNSHGDPVTSDSPKVGDTVYLVKVPRDNLLVGDGNRYPEVYEPIEAALGKPMIPYLRGFLYL